MATNATHPSRCLARFLLLGLAFAAFGQGAHAQVGALVSPGPLSRAHAALEGIKNCEKCHERKKQVSAARCLACHKPVAERIQAQKGVHAGVKDDCVACHVEHMGKDAELRPLDQKSFDHKGVTGFALDGMHARLSSNCGACHKTRTFLNLSPSCASCHRDPHKGTLGASCVACHSTGVAFAAARKTFDHTKSEFPLSGAHARVACAKCHAEGKFKGLAFASCASCHEDPHRKAFGPDCASCHGTETFSTQKVDHAKTRFPLKGRHAQVTCVSCHVKPAMKVKPPSGKCSDCHKDPHGGTFRKDCAACHDERGFKGATIDHATTRFPLTGKHASTPCASCHKHAAGQARTAARVFTGLASECSSCHQDVHKGALGPDCKRCHGTQTFRVETYVHPGSQDFFQGNHAQVTCKACHDRGGNGKVAAWKMTGVARTCASCHKDVHLGQLGSSCQDCHAVGGRKWQATGFRHDQSAFPLTGRHADVACQKCHRAETAAFPSGTGTGTRYRGLGKDCAACHADPHRGQFKAECSSCHDTKSFRVSSYVHKGPKGFFTAAHAKAPCQACHKKETGPFPAGPGPAIRFTGLATGCKTCHADFHEGAMGTECATCHSIEGPWRTPNRSFHKTRSFPLEGKHVNVPCSSCHLSGVFKGTPTRCYDCHWIRRKDDRFQTRLGTDCETCHIPSSWRSVIWNHASATGFALSGSHASLRCETCHVDGRFDGARPECYSCHKKDFEATRSPNHASAGFPTDCRLCHGSGTASWGGGTFTHSRWTLQGNHAAAACVACHQDGRFAGLPRDCYSCHQRDFNSATNPNHLMTGFSRTCETCHKVTDANWKQGKFTHTKWALQGNHATQVCTACHRNNVFAGTPQDCYSCHQKDYTAAANPNHLAAGFPQACETCHKVSDASWKQGKFTHTKWALQGNHATQVCTACHRNNV
ncbi:MAG: hypothetical protein L6R30_19840, partial [Thermoanaerobaculia bacterium]|nr:hypothetical protein [Thermoanaerobaculia bacterium]